MFKLIDEVFESKRGNLKMRSFQEVTKHTPECIYEDN